MPMRCVIGMDLHHIFAEVVVWEDGRFRHASRLDMTRSGLEGFARSLQKTDEVLASILSIFTWTGAIVFTWIG